jgi:hypothetical protein
MNGSRRVLLQKRSAIRLFPSPDIPTRNMKLLPGAGGKTLTFTGIPLKADNTAFAPLYLARQRRSRQNGNARTAGLRTAEAKGPIGGVPGEAGAHVQSG